MQVDVSITCADDIHSQLASIQGSVGRVEDQNAQTAESVRRVLRVVSTEVTDCPHLFTLVPEKPSRASRLRIYQQRYRLTLWCEHPGHWHPWHPATYILAQAREWFTRINPYVTLICKTLELVVPLAGSITDTLLDEDHLRRPQDLVQLMRDLVADLPAEPDHGLSSPGLGPATGQLTVAQDQALRAFRAVLFAHDRPRAFGGLRRVLAPSGDLLWVYEEHSPEYDPGLPTVP